MSNEEYGAGPAKKAAMKPWTHEERLEARVAELEAENKRLREALQNLVNRCAVEMIDPENVSEFRLARTLLKGDDAPQ